MYPVVFYDALRVTIGEDTVVRHQAIYQALGILPRGARDILGLTGCGNTKRAELRC